MSKAEELAYSKYPKYKKGILYDLARNSIIQGYQQAEKDLVLTVDDIRTIDRLLNKCVDCNNPYQEVLNRFNKQKER